MMRVLVLVLVSACWSSSAPPPRVAPPVPAPRRTPPPLTGPRVSGIVRDAQTGAPLADVVVEVFAPDRKLVATTTDASGAYDFEHVPEGDHQIVFRHPTAGSTQQPLMVRERPVQLDVRLK